MTKHIELWWKPASARLSRLSNLEVRRFAPAETALLDTLVRRSMSLSCTIQDGELWLRDDLGAEVRLTVGTIKDRD